MPEGVYYLGDSGIEIESIRIYGSPITPFFYNWAFNRHRGDDIKRYWDLIPNETDILITNGPAYGILDCTARGDNVGCEELLSAIKESNPNIIYLDIYTRATEHLKQTTIFINGSSLDENYQAVYAPMILEI